MDKIREAFEEWYKANLRGRRTLAWMIWSASWQTSAGQYAALEKSHAELVRFAESITDATGPYRDLDNHRIVADARIALANAEKVNG